MYLKKIRSNKESFNEVSFETGFNVIIAERTEGSTERDSRNGLGKSTLIEIIHFCLGSDFKKSSFSEIPELNGWIFTLEFTLDERDFSVSRGIDDPETIFLDGDFTGWSVLPEEDTLHNAHILTNGQWCAVLGELVFGLPKETPKYTPSFRTLISYFVRRELKPIRTLLHFLRDKMSGASRQTILIYLVSGLNTPPASKA